MFNTLLLTREVKRGRLMMTHLARPAVVRFCCRSKDGKGQGNRGPNVWARIQL
jgi:hypothetical protein